MRVLALLLLLATSCYGWQGGWPAAVEDDDLRLNSLGIGEAAPGTSGDLQVLDEITADDIHVDTLTNEAGTGAPSLTYGATAAANQDIAVSGTGAFKGSYIEASDGTTAITLTDSSALLTLTGSLTMATGKVLTAETLAAVDADGVTIRSYAGDADMLALSNGSIDVLDVTTTPSNAAVVMTWRDGTGANPITLTVDHDAAQIFAFDHGASFAGQVVVSGGELRGPSGAFGTGALYSNTQIYCDLSGTGSEAALILAGKAGNDTIHIEADNTSGQYDRLSFWGPASPASGASVEMMELSTGGTRINRSGGAGTMLSLQDGVETGGADTSGRFYVYSDGTESDSDVMLAFWDTDNNAYRTFGWDEGADRFRTSSLVEVLSTLVGNYVSSNDWLGADLDGTGSLAYLRFSGTTNATANNDRARLQMCDDDDGTIGGTTDNAGLAFVFTPSPANVAASVVGTWITSQQAVFTQQVRTPDDGELTLSAASGGAITVTGSYHTVDTFEDGASGELATINGGIDGAMLTLQAEHTDRTVVLHDNDGNLLLSGDISLDSTGDTVTLIYSGALSKWCMLSTSNND